MSMAIQRRYCKNHPDRPAIGVCVITQQAICSECSTRYEGVNYSREGLRILQERRRALETSGRRSFAGIAWIVLSPVALLLTYWFFQLLVGLFIDAIHRE
jgi:hypothetical protein